MKIVDKYGLAEQPYGTVFYEIKGQEVTSGPKILISDTYYTYDYADDGVPLFNGVQYLEPNSFLFTDKDIETGLELPLEPEDKVSCGDEKWFAVDDSSADYDDSDMFLVLSKEETIDLLKTMIKFTGTKEHLGLPDSDEDRKKN